MKKIVNSFLIIGTVSALIFSSGCKKAATIDGHVATWTEAHTPTGGATTSTTTTYSYDGQGRVVLQSPTSGNPTSTIYGSGSVTVTTGTTVTTYQLNSSGLAISDNAGNTYTYDNNGYQLAQTNGQVSSTVNTIVSGNVTNTVISQGGNSETITYNYTTTKDYRNYGLAYLGKNSTDLISSGSVAQGSNTTTYVFTQQLDSKGRVIQETLTGGNATDINTYTYTTN
jgi:YD repeat-containing protein